MNAATLTSVVMVSYHTGPTLFQAISSVLAQTTAPYLYLVDNGNTPEVVEALQAQAQQNPKLHFISGHGNIGFGAGCNLGARAASGEYLLFLNPDSLLQPAALEKLHTHAAGLKRPFMLGARLLDKDGRDQRGCRRALLTPATAFIEALHLGALFPKARLNLNEGAVPSVLTPIPAISGAFMFLPRADFLALGGFSADYFLHVEDLDLCLRFRRAGGEIYFAPDVVVTHVGGTSKATTAFLEKHKARGFSRYFHKNFAEEYPRPFLWLLDAAILARSFVKISLAGLTSLVAAAKKTNEKSVRALVL